MKFLVITEKDEDTFAKRLELEVVSLSAYSKVEEIKFSTTFQPGMGMIYSAMVIYK